MQVDKAVGNSKYLAEQVKKRDGFQLLIEPEFTNCCFWYYPQCLRGLSTSDLSKLTKVCCLYLYVRDWLSNLSYDMIEKFRECFGKCDKLQEIYKSYLVGFYDVLQL